MSNLLAFQMKCNNANRMNRILKEIYATLFRLHNTKVSFRSVLRRVLVFQGQFICLMHEHLGMGWKILSTLTFAQ